MTFYSMSCRYTLSYNISVLIKDDEVEVRQNYLMSRFYQEAPTFTSFKFH